MKFRLRLACCAAALLALAAGCKNSFLFEEENPEPHPPVLSHLVVDKTIVARDDTVNLTIDYADAGADMQVLNLRDLDGDAGWTLTPRLPPVGDEKEGKELKYFPHTRGTATGKISVKIAQGGRQRIKVWAIDSVGTWSNTLEFTLVSVF